MSTEQVCKLNNEKFLKQQICCESYLEKLPYLKMYLELMQLKGSTCSSILSQPHLQRILLSDTVFLKFQGAPESIPRNRFRQSMQHDWPVRKPYSGIDSASLCSMAGGCGNPILKRFQESIPPAYVAWLAGTATLFRNRFRQPMQYGGPVRQPYS